MTKPGPGDTFQQEMTLAGNVAVGQVAPDFELTDVEGRTVHLSDYRHKRDVVLVFTRGFT